MKSNILSALAATKESSRILATLPDATINAVLLALANELERETDAILRENAKDLARMNPDDPKYDRLLLTPERIAAMAQDLRTVAALESPIGTVLLKRALPNGLHLSKVTTPIGVIGIIYEARPNVTVDTFSLCFKSRNACALKGGSDAEFSNAKLMQCIRKVLHDAGIPETIATLLPSDREATKELLHARGLVDVIIPRGSRQLIDFVRQEATIPTIETGAGIVHIYVDTFADIQKAAACICNAKTRKPSVCNAVDTVIIHRDQLPNLGKILAPLAEKNVHVFADAQAYKAIGSAYPKSLLARATDEHFGTEFLSLKLSIKTVETLDEALKHIATYSSGHSESIIAEETSSIERFLNEVDSAAVYVNASTAFTDGAQFGMGAEIGISTQKLHARGPMGLEALTSYKWIVRGNGQVRK